MMLKQFFTRASNIIRHGCYIPTEYYVSDEKRLVYVPIAKVACTTLKIASLTDSKSNSSEQNHYMDVHSRISDKKYYSLPDRYKEYYKFAFVRNPFDRLVSCYEDKVKTPVQHNGRYFFDTNYNHVLIKRLFGNEFHPDMSFEEFIELVCKIPDFLSDGHFKSQYSILYKNNKIIVDYVGKFENIENDWNQIAQHNSLPGIDKKNSSNRNQWETYYKSNDIVKLVFERYKNDFECFNYDKRIKT